MGRESILSLKAGRGGGVQILGAIASIESI
jgi:hypothetical protein